ncbi:Hypothetical predicted protein, partial [Paramuricea clavata]
QLQTTLYNPNAIYRIQHPIFEGTDWFKHLYLYQTNEECNIHEKVGYHLFHRQLNAPDVKREYLRQHNLECEPITIDTSDSDVSQKPITIDIGESEEEQEFIPNEGVPVPKDLVVDEVSYEVKNVCDLMNAVFLEVAVCENRRLLKEKCPSCEINHPSQWRHECIMLSDEEGWLSHGLEAVEHVIERGILRKQFLEVIRVMKLEYYGRAKEHYVNLTNACEVTLDFLGNLRGFSDYQPILNYLMYWREEHCA